VADNKVSAFSAGTIEAVARVIGDLYTGSELTRIMSSAKFLDPLGEGQTKWRRVAASMEATQARQRDGQPILVLITAALAPDRALGRQAETAVARDELTQILSLSGYAVREDGRVIRATRTTTASEAAARSERLHKLLTARGAHPEVVRHCRPELLRKDCYEAVFEAVKGLGARLREKSGFDEDGRALVQAALRGKRPRVLLTDCSTVTTRNEQDGVALLAEGVFAAFRNPAAHEPRLIWDVSEQDALDVLGTLSMIHRRLDSTPPGRTAQ
jgi:uncharacterized protein (TIGR02391 family)